MAIEQTSVNMSGKWELAAALDMTKLQAEIAAFAADETMGLAKNEQKKTELKIPVYVYDADANEKGVINVVSTLPAKYENAVSHLETGANDLIVAMAGVDASAARASNEESWTVSFSCELAGDSFQMIFHKDMLVIQNYSNNTTKTALETYFATRPNLAQKSASA